MRHFYELVLEDYPCRLYFDLEFPYDVNKEASGPKLTEEFCKIVCRSLHSLLNIDLDPIKNFLILDSSSTSKFSAHVIVHVKDGENEKLFPNNVALKTIVMFICRFHLFILIFFLNFWALFHVFCLIWPRTDL